MKVDPVSDVLRVVRVSGAVVLHDTYGTPWAVSIPSSPGLAALVHFERADRVVAFHFVERGSVEFVEPDVPPRRVGPGDLIVSFGGAPHLLQHGEHASPIPLADLAARPHSVSFTSDHDDGTTLLCGVFVLEHLNRTPLLKALPDVIHLRTDAAGALARLTAQLSQEVAEFGPGSAYMISRLLELLLGEALRHAVPRLTDTQNWLGAINDPVVWSALEAIHANPGAPWTVGRIAEVSSISPSRLSARFRTATGESPMSYVTKWRMTTASQLLDTTEMSVEQVGLTVGYANQPAFTRAFGRHLGIAPRAWRDRGRFKHARGPQ